MAAKRTLFKIGVVLLLGMVGIFLFGGRTQDTSPVQTYSFQDTDTEERPSSIGTSEVREFETVRQFDSDDFKSAYDNLSLPNITPIIVAPAITGDQAADTVIQELAESRGYKLRHVASGILNEIEGRPVQEMLISDWTDLQEAAIAQGINLAFVSGYRSVEDQRELFLGRLYAAGATAEAIAASEQNDLVLSVLAGAAPPGYSRHHSGYTIDVKDPGFAIFGSSTAYVWLSRNNFEQAKLHGFIPSYPEGSSNQGPNPEPWEFVWVSKSVTYE